MEHAAANLQELYSSLGDLNADFRNNNLYSFISQRLKGKTVLDIGCGVGHFLHVARQQGFEVEGLEPDPKLIKLSQKIYKHPIPIIQKEAEKLDTIKKKYDNITMIDVLEHIEDDVGTLKKLHILLSSRGRLIILVPAYQFLYGIRDKQIGHYRRYSAAHLKEKLYKSNYEVVEARYWNVIGIPPYFFYEKILGKPVNMSLRSSKKKGVLSGVIRKVLDTWLKHVENNVSFGCGLSLLCVAEPKR